MRVAIYARVSTDDKGQDPENQLRELRAWCSNSGHPVVQEYIDRTSGRRGADKRQQFAALLDAAARQKFDCVIVLGTGSLQPRRYGANDELTRRLNKRRAL
jgi:DNA invertase Pin-like site-specific DNA recombinase